MKAKKLLALFLACSMVSGLGVSAFAEGESAKDEVEENSATIDIPQCYGTPDTQEPTVELESISIKKIEKGKAEETEVTEFNVGDTIKLTVKATDDISGIDRIYLAFALDGQKFGWDYDLQPSKNDPTLFEGSFEFKDDDVNGKYTLNGVYARDYAGNEISLYNTDENPGVLPSITYTVSGMTQEAVPEQKMPEITELKITNNATSFKPGDKIEFSAIIKNIDCYENNVQVDFKKSGNDDYQIFNLSNFYLDDSDEPVYLRENDPTYFGGRVYVGTYAKAGEYTISGIRLNGDEKEITIPENLKNLSFSIENEPQEFPKLTKITVDKTRVKAPGFIEITAELDKPLEDGAVYCQFSNERRVFDFYLDNSNNEPTNIFKLKINMSEFEESGTYKLNFVEVYDYYNDNLIRKYGNEGENSNLPLPNQVSFEIVNDDPTENNKVLSTVNKDALIKGLTELKDGQTAHVYVGNSSDNTLITADVFKAFRGKNVNVSFDDNGVEVIFNGKDINEGVEDTYLDYDSAIIDKLIDSDLTNFKYADKLKAHIGDNKCFVHAFLNNAICQDAKPFPASKATVKLKTDDFLLGEYLGQDKLTISKYDIPNDTLTPIASDVTIDEDGFIVFEMTSYEDFVITTNTKYTPAPTPTPTPNPNQGGGSSGGGGGSSHHHHSSGGGGGSRGGGGGASGGGGGAVSAPASKVTNVSLGGAKTEKPISLANSAVTPAQIKQARIDNGTAWNKPIHIDTYEGNNVRGRFYIDQNLANKLTKPFKTQIFVDQNQSDNKAGINLFSKWFENKIMAVTFEEKGDSDGKFEQTMPVAVKVNFEGFKGDKVYVYRYNKEKNSYRFLQVCPAVKDDLSYFYFDTPYAATMIFTDGPLKDRPVDQVK